MEDNISHELYTNGLETAKNFNNKEDFTNDVVSLFTSYIESRKETFETQLERIKVQEEETI